MCKFIKLITANCVLKDYYSGSHWPKGTCCGPFIHVLGRPGFIPFLEGNLKHKPINGKSPPSSMMSVIVRWLDDHVTLHQSCDHVSVMWPCQSCDHVSVMWPMFCLLQDWPVRRWSWPCSVRAAQMTARPSALWGLHTRSTPPTWLLYRTVRPLTTHTYTDTFSTPYTHTLSTTYTLTAHTQTLHPVHMHTHTTLQWTHTQHIFYVFYLLYKSELNKLFMAHASCETKVQSSDPDGD